jgi:hypothetical protein
MVEAKKMARQIDLVREMFENLEMGEGGLVDTATRHGDLLNLLNEVVALGQIVQESCHRESLEEVSDRDLDQLARRWMNHVG